MSVSRVVLGCLLGVVVPGAVLFACSSFTATDTPGADDGGADGDASSMGSETGGEGDGAGPCDLARTGTDPQNCGKCGHSCLGGACDASVCQPLLVGTSNDEAVIDVAVDAQRVMWLTSSASSGFWSGAGHVFGCPREGCPNGGPGTSLTGPPVSTGNLAGDGTKAFFSVAYGGGVNGIRAILPNGVVQTVGQLHAEAVRLQIRDGNLFFVTLYETPPSGFTGHVYRWDGKNETLLGDFASPHNLADMVVIGNRAFFSALETSFLGACPIGDPAPPTCTPTDFTVGGTAYVRLTTDGTSVIWTDTKDVLSCRADQTTCTTPTPLVGQAQLNANVTNLVFDHGHLYVTTAGNEIFQCSLPDCVGTIRKLAHESSRLLESTEALFGHSLAADDTAVYWSAVDGMAVPDGDGGFVRSGVTHRLMKVAK